MPSARAAGHPGAGVQTSPLRGTLVEFVEARVAGFLRGPGRPGGDQLAADGVKARVVSMPSWELFDRQDQAYRDQVLPPSVTARVAVEQASTFGWHRWVGATGAIIGMSTFGASAPSKPCRPSSASPPRQSSPPPTIKSNDPQSNRNRRSTGGSGARVGDGLSSSSPSSVSSWWR